MMAISAAALRGRRRTPKHLKSYLDLGIFAVANPGLPARQIDLPEPAVSD
jgi:hypothetical protein